MGGRAGTLAWPAWILFAVVFVWTPPHFWALAMKVRDDYAAAGIPMMPVVRGGNETRRQILLYSLVLFAVTLLLVPVASMGPIYLATAVGLSAILVAFGLSAILLLMVGASPFDAFALIFSGSFDSLSKLAYVMTAWAPVLLCSAGLLVTFAAGLWNIGIEGQVVMGAVFATGVMQALQNSFSPTAELLLAALAGLLGGAMWGMFTGALKLYGNVNEIFGGLGLNFIAGSLTVYLVLGPWKRPGIGSTSGTEPFPPSLWLLTFKGFQVSPIERSPLRKRLESTRGES